MANQQRELDALDKQVQALELRKAGVRYSDIAEKLGYKSASGAFAAVRSALIKTLREPADELRTLELERLDALWLTYYPMAKRGDRQAMDRCIKIMERRAKLLGLDAPQRTETTGAGGGPIQIEQYQRALDMVYGQERDE